MENVIQFVANYEDWQAVKKLKVEEKTGPKMVMEFLASLGTSLDSKIEANLKKTVELDVVDGAIAGIECGKSENEIASALKSVNSRAVSSAINSICEKPELHKNEQKELKQFCKVYVTRKVLKNCGLEVDYSNVDIPGMKRTKKKKA